MTPIQDVIPRISNRLAQKFVDFHAIGIFSYGSRVYGYKDVSDHDLIYVITAKDLVAYKEQEQFEDLNTDVTVYSHDEFLRELANHEISALECMYLPKQHVHVLHPILEPLFNNVPINKASLRSAISKKASNSYVKAKKKLIIEEDYDLECSIKSMFHSFRIFNFGTQIANDGKISDYAAANEKYIEVIQTYMGANANWEKIHEALKPIHNEAATAFKLVAPKG